MSKPHFVYIINQSGVTQNYLFFSAPPHYHTSNSTVSGAEVFLNVWLTQPGIAPGGDKAIFEAGPDNFAITGAGSTSITSGTVASISSSMPVVLMDSSQPGTTPDLEVVDGVPRLTLSSNITSELRSFGINSGALEDSNQYVYAGLGKNDYQNNVVPTAIWQIQPNQQYRITPCSQYFVSLGSHQQRTILGMKNLGLFISVDFQEDPGGAKVATITHQVDGSFSATQWSFA